MFDPDKWAESVDNQLKKRADQANQSQQMFLERRKMLAQEGPLFWPKVREASKQCCDAYNKRKQHEVLFFADIGDKVFTIKRTDAAGMELIVEQVRGIGYKINVQSQFPKYRQVYQPQIFDGGDGSVELCSSDNVPVTPEEVATAAMSAFLGAYQTSSTATA